MAHDVFISYAHKDKPTGDAVCATLEGRGIRCWMAPRDVLPGVIYSAAIVEAIRASRVFVLVFSAEANISPHVMRELERAVHAGIAVLPLRIEDVPLSPSMEYFISTPHWLDALTPPLEQHLVRLADTVKLLLEKAEAETEAVRAAAAPPGPSVPVAVPVAPSETATHRGPGDAPVRQSDDRVATAVAERALESPPNPVDSAPTATVAPTLPAERSVTGVGTAERTRRAAGVFDSAAARIIALVVGLAVVVVGGSLVLSSSPGPGPTGLASRAPSAAASIRPSSTAPGATQTSAPATPQVASRTGSLVAGRMQHSATLLADGRVLVAGGEANAEGTRLATAELFDPATGTWTSTGSMTTRRAGHMSVLLKDGKVLAIAGTDGDWVPGGGDTVELYDPHTGEWTRTGSLNGYHPDATATLLKSGEVLIAGGDDGEARYNSEIYNPSTGRWRAGGAMKVVRQRHTATLLADGRVLVVGGARQQSGPNPEAAIASAEIYNPATVSWTGTASIGVARADHVAALLPDGRVLIAGGSMHDADEGEAPLGSSELYDPDSRTWSAVGDLLTARSAAAAAVLADGRVVVIGGRGTNNLTACEVYDPVAATWAVGPILSIGLSGHTATALADGRRVLAAGGGEGNPMQVAYRYAEIFSLDPGG